MCGGGGFSPKRRTVSLFFLARNSRQKSVEFSPLAGHELQKEAGRGCRRTRMADQLQVSFVPPLTVHFGRRVGGKRGGDAKSGILLSVKTSWIGNQASHCLSTFGMTTCEMND